MAEFFPPGKVYDFMKWRTLAFTVSGVLCLLSVIGLFYPGPNYGIDFSGGTKVQLEFKKPMKIDQLRKVLDTAGFDQPEAIAVANKPNEFIISVREREIPQSQLRKKEAEVEAAIKSAVGDVSVDQVRLSPVGDKIAFRFGGPVELSLLESTLKEKGYKVREVNRFGNESDFRAEAYLFGTADRLVKKLDEVLGDAGPKAPKSVNWEGPRAGAQLRDSAVKALLYAIFFILVYVAFRFDLRFAPGGVVALIHDALITAGVFVLLRKEFNITTVASLLTIIGYSINDTIVVFDRIRENMSRHRTMSLRQVINLSMSQTLSRTIITSGVTMLSLLAFFVFGTGVIKDIAFALVVGMLVGSYSSIYIAAPIIEWMDQKFFKKMNTKAGVVSKSSAQAVVRA